MRNLRLKYNQRYKGIVQDPKFLLLNPNCQKSSDCRYVVTTDKLFAFVPGVKDSLKVLAEVPDIVAAEYLALDNDICLATGVGEVLLVNADSQQVNEGTFCDVGIECMSWSPDQEVVVFVTKQHNVVVMTCTYDPLTEHSLNDESSEVEGEFVNVGWGKKETQFHGSEGKQAAKQKQDDKLDANVDEIPKDIVISWRADGAYFVVSYVSQSRGRTFKVFDKEGKLQYLAEKQSNLCHPTSWRPSGNWIAIPQRLPNKSTIALFEKNGLRHRELTLPFDLQQEPVEDIKWSSDSEILTIKTEHKLYLFTIGNYHWYLKQVLDFQNVGCIAHYNWDNRMGEEKTLHVLFTNGEYLIYKWYWTTDRLKSTGVVAVVDGRRLLLTDFSKAVIPPPMCTQELALQGDSYIISLTFVQSIKKNHLCVYDSKHQLHYYKSVAEKPLAFAKIGSFELQPSDSEDLIPLQYANVQWITSSEENYLLACFTRDNKSKLQFFRMEVPDTYAVMATVNVSRCITQLQTSVNEENCNVFCQLFYQTLEDYEISQLEYDVSADSEIVHRLHAKLDHSIEVLETYTETADTNTVALSNNQCLYVNSERIATDVTSFCMAGKYLAFTKLTSLHFLRCSDMKLVDERRLERGAKLVTTVCDSARTILQMPRGNLEAICPRVLSLDLVGALLNSQHYCQAFDMLRKQRINLNIICDHNMCDFVERLDVFLAEIQNPNWLNLFLSDLQNEDFTKTMYASNYKENSQKYPEDFKIEEKVVYLCKAICKRMEESSEKLYRLPIITAYVKLKQLEKALLLIWEEKKREKTNNETSGGSEEALKYLLYLVDVNELYNVALGTYDFGLVLFVAQKSQKDPKEFLAFLNELKGYELNYRKFKIDEHLRRFEKALQHIASCGKEKFDEALSFIKRHEYYAQSLRAFQDDEDCYQQICLAFADHLRANNKLENASILYERGGNIQQALLSSKHTLDWQRAIMLAKQSEQDEATVAISLVAPLQEHGKYEEAYLLSKKYSQNIKDSLQCLIKGRLFLTAIYETKMLADAIETQELLQTLIIPEILNYQQLLVNTINADEDLFISHKKRLLEVRQNRAKHAQFLAEGGDDGHMDIDECDLLSDTTSLHSSRYTASSRGTGKTFRSSKNRRKHERKLLSLKPGNPFEDIALIDALYNQITRCYEQQQHIRDTCKALLQLQQDSAAFELQKRFKCLLSIIQDSLDDIWIAEMLQSSTQQFLQGPNIDYTQLQNEQRYAMISPIKRFKPQLNLMDWEHDILLY